VPDDHQAVQGVDLLLGLLDEPEYGGRRDPWASGVLRGKVKGAGPAV
jgi:hypothetical protein